MVNQILFKVFIAYAVSQRDTYFLFTKQVRVLLCLSGIAWGIYPAVIWGILNRG